MKPASLITIFENRILSEMLLAVFIVRVKRALGPTASGAQGLHESLDIVDHTGAFDVLTRFDRQDEVRR